MVDPEKVEQQAPEIPAEKQAEIPKVEQEAYPAPEGQPHVYVGMTVLYKHAGSADGKYPPMTSPAIVQAVLPNSPEKQLVDLFVMSVTGGIFFAKSVPFGQWTEVIKFEPEPEI